MQAWCLVVCFLVYASGQEYALKFSAANKSRVWFGNIIETKSAGGVMPCRECDSPSDLCYPDYNGVYYFTDNNFSSMVLPVYEMTLETWVRFDELNSTTHLISVSDGVDEARNIPAAGFRLGFFRGFPTFGVANGVTSQNWPNQDLLGVSGPSALQWVMGRWYHMAGTWDGTYRKLYIDGELMDAYKPSYPVYLNQYSTAQFTLGGSAHCDLEILFSGSLTEVRMWDVARTAEQIAAGMNVRATGSEPNLIGLWRDITPDGNVPDLSNTQPLGISRAIVKEPLSAFPPPQTQPRWTVGTSPCKKYTGSFCASVVDYPYFAPNNTWQWRTEATLRSMSVLESLASPTCFPAALKHLCSLWYPRCMQRNVTQLRQPNDLVNYTAVTYQTWVPMPVSRDSCLALGVACAKELNLMQINNLRSGYNLAAYQLGRPDNSLNFSECAGSWLLRGNDSMRGVAFPFANSSTHTYGSLMFADPFIEYNSSSTGVLAPKPTPCEYPMILRSTYTEEAQTAYLTRFLTLEGFEPSHFVNSPYCTIQCPPPLMLPSQYSTYTRATGGLALFSFIFSLLIALFILRDPAKRRFPGLLMMLILASVIGLSFSLALSLFGGWDDYFCLDNHNREASQGDSALCDTQAVLVQFFLAATQGYWCSMCVFLHSVLKMKPSTRWVPYTVIPLLPALFSVILLASLGKMGLASTGNMCWVKSGETGFVWGLYYAPGLLNAIFSLYIIISYAYNRKGFKTDAAFLRMLQMTTLLFVSAIFSIAAQSHVSAKHPVFIEAVGSFLTCRNFALAYRLVRDLNPGYSNTTQNLLDRLRSTGGFAVSGDPSSCKPFDSIFVVGVFYVDQIVFALLGTLVPIILIAKQTKKVFCYDRWSARSKGSTKTMSNIGSSSRLGAASDNSGSNSNRSLPPMNSDISLNSRTDHFPSTDAPS